MSDDASSGFDEIVEPIRAEERALIILILSPTGVGVEVENPHNLNFYEVLGMLHDATNTWAEDGALGFDDDDDDDD